MAKAKPKPFGVGSCSLCEKITLTFGEQKHGGVRWCEDCLKLSFGWVQMDEEQRSRIGLLFSCMRELPKAKKLLEQASGIDDEMKQAIAIGEARYRMVMADIEEAGRD